MARVPRRRRTSDSKEEKSARDDCDGRFDMARPSSRHWAVCTIEFCIEQQCRKPCRGPPQGFRPKHRGSSVAPLFFSRYLFFSFSLSLSLFVLFAKAATTTFARAVKITSRSARLGKKGTRQTARGSCRTARAPTGNAWPAPPFFFSLAREALLHVFRSERERKKKGFLPLFPFYAEVPLFPFFSGKKS